jgi:hypothetical protein
MRQENMKKRFNKRSKGTAWCSADIVEEVLVISNYAARGGGGTPYYIVFSYQILCGRGGLYFQPRERARVNRPL